MENLLIETIRKVLLREEKFHELSGIIKFTFDLTHDSGGHTELRKKRHGLENIILDSDIIKLLEDAKEEIIYSIIDRDIINNRRFIVSRDGGDYLNVIIHPEKIDTAHWNLVTITVMRKKGFTVGERQLQLFIPQK